MLLGEASVVVTKGIPRMLLALAEVPRVARADVGSLRVSFKNLD
jgi:hypothetical protein